MINRKKIYSDVLKCYFARTHKNWMISAGLTQVLLVNPEGHVIIFQKPLENPLEDMCYNDLGSDFMAYVEKEVEACSETMQYDGTEEVEVSGKKVKICRYTSEDDRSSYFQEDTLKFFGDPADLTIAGKGSCILIHTVYNLEDGIDPLGCVMPIRKTWG